MTVPATAVRIGRRLPSAQEKETANQLRQMLAMQVSGDAKLSVLAGERKPVDLTLAPGLSELLMEVLRHVGSGDAVTVVPVNQMLTTKQAADILNVSRPFLVGLIDKGAIPHTMVGRHRRVRAEDLFAYKDARAVRRDQALSTLAEMDAAAL